jgi:cellobiose-specific phosphotransferase system component IIC
MTLPDILLILLLLAYIAAPILAARKGYRWHLWILGGGVLGLSILAFLPFANRPDQTEERQKNLRNTGNIVGIILSAFTLVFAVLMYRPH